LDFVQDWRLGRRIARPSERVTGLPTAWSIRCFLLAEKIRYATPRRVTSAMNGLPVKFIGKQLKQAHPEKRITMSGVPDALRRLAWLMKTPVPPLPSWWRTALGTESFRSSRSGDQLAGGEGAVQ
jgi:hypothetical protein